MAPLAAHHRSRRSLVLATSLALLSYVPFEAVAKLTLAVCAVMFVADPFPPTSRLVSVISVAVVALLARTLRRYQLEEQQQKQHREQEEDEGLRLQQHESNQVKSGEEKDERERKKDK